MFRFVLVFLAGVPVGWTWCFWALHDTETVLYGLAASGLFLLSAWGAKEKPAPAGLSLRLVWPRRDR